MRLPLAAPRPLEEGPWLSGVSSEMEFHSPQASQRPAHFWVTGAAGGTDETGDGLGHGAGVAKRAGKASGAGGFSRGGSVMLLARHAFSGVAGFSVNALDLFRSGEYVWGKQKTRR